MSKPVRLDDPYFNEFIFQCIYNAPQDAKNKLPLHLLKFTNSVERMKTFAEKAKMEKKLEMWMRLGGAYSLALHPPGWLSKERLDEALENFLTNNRDRDVNEMAEKNVFFTGDREYMALRNLMAMNCHNGTYMLNRDYPLIATQISNGEKINSRIPDSELSKSVLEDQKVLCKFMLYALLNQNFICSAEGYRTKDLMILLYLFLNRHNYTDLKQISAFFESVYSPPVVSAVLNGLMKNDHVIKLPRRYCYTISGAGIRVIGDIVNRIINHTLYH